jgi:hypothetical protein
MREGGKERNQKPRSNPNYEQEKDSSNNRVKKLIVCPQEVDREGPHKGEEDHGLEIGGVIANHLKFSIL